MIINSESRCPLFQVGTLGKNIEKCFGAIKTWMDEFFLRVNSNKTKILMMCPTSMKPDLDLKGTFIDGK